MFGGASSVSGKVDAVFLYISALTIAFLVFITAVMLYFVVRYRRSRGPQAKDIHGNTVLELLWTGIPLALFLTMFYYGWTNYRYLREVPRDAMVINVTARQWAWSFTYPNGRQTTELYVALNRPVRINLKSLDVLSPAERKEFAAVQASPFFDVWASAAIDEMLSALYERQLLGR